MSLELYKPSSGGFTDSKRPLDPTRCACGVTSYIGRWPRYGQCANRGKYERVIGGQTVKVCHTHRPEVVQSRKAKADARYEAQTNKWKRQTHRPGDYRDALQRIADGDNDPRQTARDVLDKWGDYKEPGQ
jgi:hypothetical protein